MGACCHRSRRRDVGTATYGSRLAAIRQVLPWLPRRSPTFARVAFTGVVACAPALRRGRRSRLAVIRQGLATGLLGVRPWR
jgi:hypothetical protein